MVHWLLLLPLLPDSTFGGQQGAALSAKSCIER